MPTRRALLRTAALGAAVLALPSVPFACPPPQQPLVNDRLVRRAEFIWNRARSSVQAWRYCTFADLRKGDIFELFEPDEVTSIGRFEALADPEQNERGVWGVEADVAAIDNSTLYIREGFDMLGDRNAQIDAALTHLIKNQIAYSHQNWPYLVVAGEVTV